MGGRLMIETRQGLENKKTFESTLDTEISGLTEGAEDHHVLDND